MSASTCSRTASAWRRRSSVARVFIHARPVIGDAGFLGSKIIAQVFEPSAQCDKTRLLCLNLREPGVELGFAGVQLLAAGSEPNVIVLGSFLPIVEVAKVLLEVAGVFLELLVPLIDINGPLFKRLFLRFQCCRETVDANEIRLILRAILFGRCRQLPRSQLARCEFHFSTSQILLALLKTNFLYSSVGVERFFQSLQLGRVGIDRTLAFGKQLLPALQLLDAGVDVLEPLLMLLLLLLELDGSFAERELHALQFFAASPVFLGDIAFDLCTLFRDDGRIFDGLAAAGLQLLTRGPDLRFHLLATFVPEDAVGLQFASLFVNRLGACLEFAMFARPFLVAKIWSQRWLNDGGKLNRHRLGNAERD